MVCGDLQDAPSSAAMRPLAGPMSEGWAGGPATSPRAGASSRRRAPDRRALAPRSAGSPKRGDRRSATSSCRGRSRRSLRCRAGTANPRCSQTPPVASRRPPPSFVRRIGSPKLAADRGAARIAAEPPPSLAKVPPVPPRSGYRGVLRRHRCRRPQLRPARDFPMSPSHPHMSRLALNETPLSLTDARGATQESASGATVSRARTRSETKRAFLTWCSC